MSPSQPYFEQSWDSEAARRLSNRKQAKSSAQQFPPSEHRIRLAKIKESGTGTRRPRLACGTRTTLHGPTTTDDPHGSSWLPRSQLFVQPQAARLVQSSWNSWESLIPRKTRRGCRSEEWMHFSELDNRCAFLPAYGRHDFLVRGISLDS